MFLFNCKTDKTNTEYYTNKVVYRAKRRLYQSSSNFVCPMKKKPNRRMRSDKKSETRHTVAEPESVEVFSA